LTNDNRESRIRGKLNDSTRMCNVNAKFATNCYTMRYGEEKFGE